MFTTLLPIGTMVYYKGCDENPIPDFGTIIAHQDHQSTFCTVRNEDVLEPHYIIEWYGGNTYRTTQRELNQPDFITLEEPCN